MDAGVGVAGLAALGPGAGGRAGPASAGLAAFGFGLANGWNDALFYVLAMEASDPRMPASTCALFMSVTNLSVTGGGVFAGGVSAFGGRYRPVFAIAGAAGPGRPPADPPAQAAGRRGRPAGEPASRRQTRIRPAGA